MLIGVLTAMDLEYEAVRSLLELSGPISQDQSGNLLGTIPGSGGTHELILAPYSYGRDKTASSATTLLVNYPDIDYLIFVGIAGACKQNDAGDIVDIGDLVISRSVVDIENAKLNPDGTIKYRSEHFQPSGKLLSYARVLISNIESEPNGWKERIEEMLASSNKELSLKWQTILQQHIPRIEIGSIGSSMKNINDPKVRDEWCKSDYRIRAFEMEGVGIAAAAHEHDIGYLIIRGISDKSDGTRDDVVNQPYASRVAVSFLGLLFQYIPPNLANTTLHTEILRTVNRERQHLPVYKGSAPINAPFYGREEEVDTLVKWVSHDKGNSKLIFILGSAGKGKGAIAAQLLKKMGSNFDYKLWVNLTEVHPLTEVVEELIAEITGSVPASEKLSDLLSFLFDLLREKKALLILDGFEHILQREFSRGAFLDGYENYKYLIDGFASWDLKSCLVVTSRENIWSYNEGDESRIHSLFLNELDPQTSQRILIDKDLKGNDSDWKEFTSICGGNPTIIIKTAGTIVEQYDRNIRKFLTESGKVVVGSIEELIEEDVKRYTQTERKVAYFLAIEKEPVSLKVTDWFEALILPMSVSELTADLENMKRKFLLKRSDTGYSLENPVAEFLINQLIAKIANEIRSETPEMLNSHILLNSQDKEYIRVYQRKEILRHISRKLADLSNEEIASNFKNIISKFKTMAPRKPGYLASNILSLLSELKISLEGWNFSNMAVWNANLQDLELKGVDFSSCNFKNTIFRDMFGSVTSLSFTPKGDRIIAGTFDGEFRVWEVNTGKQIKRFDRAHNDWVSSVSVSPNGLNVLTGSSDDTVKVWDLESQSLIKEPPIGHARPVRGAYFVDDNEIVSGSEDSTIRFWNLETGENKVLTEHTGVVKAMDVFPSKGLMVSGGDDGQIILWDVNAATPLRKWKNGDQNISIDKVRSLAFGPDGDTFASGSDDGWIRIWSVNESLPILQMKGDSNKVWSLAFNRNGAILASGGNDGTIRIWNSKSGDRLKQLYGHLSWVRSLKFSPVSDLLVSGSEDQTLRFWDISSGSCTRVFSGTTKRIYSVAYSPNDEFLISGAGDHNVYLWKLSDKSLVHTFIGHNDQVWTVATSPYGSLFASGSDDKTVKVWSMDNLKLMATSEEHGSWIGSVAFSRDGKLLASGSDDKKIRVWETSLLRNHQHVSILENGVNGRVSSLVFLTNNEEILSGDEDGKVRLWNIKEPNPKAVLDELGGRVYTIAYNEARDILAGAGSKGVIEIWKLKERKVLLQLGPIDKVIWSISFDPSGKYLYCASDGADILIWDIDQKKMIGTFNGHTRKIWSIAVSNDGKRIASGSEDGVIIEWDLNTKNELRRMSPPGPYDKMFIKDITGLTSAELSTVLDLGATESNQYVNLSHEEQSLERINENYSSLDIQSITKIAITQEFETELNQTIGGFTFDIILSKKIKNKIIGSKLIEIVCVIMNEKMSEESVKVKLTSIGKVWKYSQFQHVFLFSGTGIPPGLVTYLKDIDKNTKFKVWLLDTPDSYKGALEYVIH